MSVTIEDIKSMMAVDGNDDDTLIEGYLTAATSFVKNAIGNDETFFEKEDVVPPF